MAVGLLVEAELTHRGRRVATADHGEAVDGGRAARKGDTMTSVSEMLDRFVDQFNESRFEEALQDYADGGVQEEIGTGRRFTPQEAVESARALLQYIVTGVPRAERGAMREELRAMLVAYLGPWLRG